MQKPDWNLVWLNLRKYLLNKYVLVCLLFAFVLAFCGEQSLVNRIARARRIAAMEKELDAYRSETERYQRDLDNLENSPDNLERFAREHYYMHAPDEDVYLIDE
ncbi:MAG: septum formation initiator family protein [Paludibacteraceae bacterium]|nr:septum formation initiator family protein [Paludibacteraceae bacterium]